MNKVRREQLKEAIKTIEIARDMVESVRYEESDAFDNLSEGLQASERGMTMEENVDTMDEVISNLEEAVDTIMGII